MIQPREASPIRSDIQGLRGVAIGLVVISHFFPGFLPGGFIGVDIFFVISGFVITQQIISSERSGFKERLIEFYAKRVRRILPSATLVIWITLTVNWLLLGPVYTKTAARDGFFATVFLANVHFENSSLDYFNTTANSSMFSHFWSLSIEEQFYLFWPLIVIGLLMFASSLRVTLLTVGILAGASLAYALYSVDISETARFFSSAARFWELLAGGFLAFLVTRFKLPHLHSFLFLTFVLVLAIVIAPTLYWPNFITIAIVLATAAVLTPNASSRYFDILKTRVLVFLGDISYVLYLWHWPVLMIIKEYYFGLTPFRTLIALVASLALAISTHYLLEKPIRRSPWVALHPRMTILIGVSTITITASSMWVLQ
jgi:peptidoglycan/LPS O-acetylase OafA/YrhL